jgi:hypothetical protein
MIKALEAQVRGSFPVADEKGNKVGFYKGSYALLVGASTYREGWSKLPGVLNDIKTVESALKERGFTVRVISDPDHEALKGAFEDFINSFGLEPDAPLLLRWSRLHLTPNLRGGDGVHRACRRTETGHQQQQTRISRKGLGHATV